MTTTETPQISPSTATTASTATQPTWSTSTLLPESTSTVTPFPYLTLTSAPTNIPNLYSPRAMKDDEQLYLDPEGWFSVYIPADWKEGEIAGSFSGEDGFVEIGYLPELGFMRYNLSVSVWLANIVEQPENTNIWLSGKLETVTEMGEIIVQTVFKNPAAGYKHRFVHIKADKEHFPWVENSFAWQQPELQETELAYHQMELRPEDLSFWDNKVSLPEDITVTEYKLSVEGQNALPGDVIFGEFLSPEAREIRDEIIENYLDLRPEKISNEDILATFGYELREDPDTRSKQLYKNGELLFDNVYGQPGKAAIFSTTSGEALVFALNTVTPKPNGSPEFHSYVVQDGESIEREYQNNAPGYPPFMYNGEVLWVRVKGTHVQIENSQQRVLFDFSTYFGTNIPFKFFQSWENHWIVGIGNFIIQDEEILNEKYGYEEAFDWQRINDKPLYFFRKGKRVGISYDGEILPLYYHDIIHGYCCGLMWNNPVRWGNHLHFYGRRDGVWYFVMMEFK